MTNRNEVVPGMAEAIERRRKELGLSPGEFADAAGVTGEGLRAVRKGYRRDYRDKVRLGVARALRWPPDAIDRLLAGEEPTAGAEPPPIWTSVTLDELIEEIKQRLASATDEERHAYSVRMQEITQQVARAKGDDTEDIYVMVRLSDSDLPQLVGMFSNLDDAQVEELGAMAEHFGAALVHEPAFLDDNVVQLERAADSGSQATESRPAGTRIPTGETPEEPGPP